MDESNPELSVWDPAWVKDAGLSGVHELRRSHTAMALQDAAGRRRSSATLPGYHAGRPPRNKGLRYPADPPSVEEIVAVMRQAGTSTQGLRVRALVVILWIGEALAVTEPDLDAWLPTDHHEGANSSRGQTVESESGGLSSQVRDRELPGMRAQTSRR